MELTGSGVANVDAGQKTTQHRDANQQANLADQSEQPSQSDTPAPANDDTVLFASGGALGGWSLTPARNF